MRALRSTEVLIALVIVILFLLLGWFDYRRQTRAVERFDTFSSYDFQHGGYRAWYDVLNREGIRVSRYQRRPAYLNDSISTLIIANNVFDLGLRAQVGQQIGTYTQSDFDKLRKWVESGGRLGGVRATATRVRTPGAGGLRGGA